MEIPYGPPPNPNEHRDDMFGMAIRMMAVSAGVLFLIAVIPAVGFASGFVLAVLTVAAALLPHRRWTRRDN